jgi:thiamine biosynthesis lipoprotein ApbE
MADVTATAAYLLGPDRALAFIEEMGMAGLCVTDELQTLMTPTMGAYRDG